MKIVEKRHSRGGSSSKKNNSSFKRFRNGKSNSTRVKSGGGFRNGRRGGNRNKRKMPIFDPSKFINANPVDEVEEVFIPKNSFQTLDIDSKIVRTLESQGISSPTPIQDQTIPETLNGRDIVGLAETGTGKTAAFLIPLIQKTILDNNHLTLILAPTRELAIQINEELRGLVKGYRIFSTVCVGGINIRPQISSLRRTNHFIIGTSGRTLDLIKRKSIRPHEINAVVLDEADRMLDMGFIHDIRFLMSHVSEKRQTLCFSATMSTTIERLINDFLKDPSTISVKTVETPKNIEQGVIRVRNLNKVDVLHDLLKNDEFKKVLVFGRTKHGVENLSRILMRRGIKVESIHGNKTQAQRKRALLSFKQNRVQALVATDVAARGLHISNITHVINYEIPETYDDYIHRIGRTGRGTQKGKALTFID